MRDVVVVGAGVSGLTCARRLQAANIDVLVLEAQDRPGGVVWTEAVDGYLFECGPNTIVPTPESMDLISEAGLENAMVRAPKKAPRFVYVEGRLRRVPWVLSVGGALRGLSEPFVPRRTSGDEESLKSFFERRFGRQVHDRLAAPFVSGIYAGDTAELGMRSVFPRLNELEARYRSVLIGMLRGRRNSPRYGLRSFRKGMGTLARGLAEGLDIEYGAKVTELRPGWTLTCEGQEHRARAVVLAVPAWSAAQLTGASDPTLAALLESVPYAPIVTAGVAVADAKFPTPLTGFGYLVTASSGLDVLGTLFNSALFPDRSPRGETLLTSFLGGTRSPGIVDWDDARVWTTVCGEVEHVLKLSPGSAKPVRLKRYRRAIPQYRLGHRDWRGRVESQTRAAPGLFLTGNYLEGVSVPATMAHGAKTAGDVMPYIRRMHETQR